MKIGQHGKFELHMTDSGVWSNPNISLIINCDGRLIPAIINGNVADYTWGLTATQVIDDLPNIGPHHLSCYIQDMGADWVAKKMATEKLQFGSMNNPPNLEDEAHYLGDGKMEYRAFWVGDDWICVNFIREGVDIASVEIQKDTMLFFDDRYRVNAEEFIKEHGMIHLLQGYISGDIRIDPYQDMAFSKWVDYQNEWVGQS